MHLRDIQFRNVLNSSGARNFFGEGWWYHKFFKPFGLDYTGSTFVAKTTTLLPQKGNLGTKEYFPACVKVYPWKGIALNAVGLSGPGALSLFEARRWQKRSEPFMLSFMATGQTLNERVGSAESFAHYLNLHLPDFKAPIALQVNFSCPNINSNLDDIGIEAQMILKLLSEADVPLIPKVNCLFPIPTMMEISQHWAVDAVCVSNTIPWGKIPEADRTRMFGTTVSPLEKFGGGGLSGKYLFPKTKSYIHKLRRAGFKKSIIAGGGVLDIKNISDYILAGADAVELGSVSMLRPWRVKNLIEFAGFAFPNET